MDEKQREIERNIESDTETRRNGMMKDRGTREGQRMKKKKTKREKGRCQRRKEDER